MIPQGWQEKTLGEVCIVERGSSPRPIKNFITDDGSGVNWIKIGDCSGKYVTNTAQKITEEGAKKSRHVKEGDFVISNSMSYGKPYILKIDGYIHDGWFVLRLNKNLVNADYFYYLLSSNYVKEQYDALATGAIVQNISSDLIKRVQFNLPPLSEQERIVAKLDKAFEAIDKVKANAEQNLNNTKELFNNTLDSKIRTLYKNSSTQKLSEVCDVRDGTHDSPKYLDKRGHPFVTSKNLKNDKIDMEKITYISDSDFEKINERSKVDIGDVLFAMIGTIGNPVVITEEPDFAIKNVALFKNINKLEPLYLKFLLKSPSVLLKMQLEANGTTQKFVALKYLRNFMVPVPSLSEQQKIVEKLDALQEQTKQLEQIYTQKIKKCDELKQSILQKAFRGEL